MLRYLSIFISIFLLGTITQAKFLPDNVVVYETDADHARSNLTEQEFNSILKRIADIYDPIIKSHGGNLTMNGQWSNKKLNAGARQLLGRWEVMITGALARRPELTRDGFALIVCHELGHHLGGFPYAPLLPVPIPVPGVEIWAAVEGQADYYATHVCTHKIWGDQLEENAKYRETATVEVKSMCNEIWDTNESQNICYRSLTAAASMIELMANLMEVEQPRWDTPDPSVVDETNTKHPAAQCRMDTSLQAALCTADFNEQLIPGKSVSKGTDSAEAEREAMENSCSKITNYEIGRRPLCWFKSKI